MGYLTTQLSKRTSLLGVKLWVILGIGVGAAILILFVLSLWLLFKKKKASHGSLLQEDKFRLHSSGNSKIPSVSKEIQEVKVADTRRTPFRSTFELSGPDKIVVHVDAVEAEAAAKPTKKFIKENTAAGYVQQTLSHYDTPDRSSYSPGSFVHLAGLLPPPALPGTSPNPVVGPASEHITYGGTSGESRSLISSPLPEAAHLGWGHWFTLRELEAATDGFVDCNVLGEGGYGIVYKGRLPDGTAIAVKNLLNNRGQAEREFRVEVEAIGRVRHKNLVRLLGYCVEGNHRMLVYEYVDNGNLDQWLHGPIARTRTLSWDSRMKIILGTAKALAYLHEALEPKVVHRDIKSSNILIDTTYHAKISDFGLAKLLGADKSHVTTRVMGTFGYVAPEYANTGLLNERSDVYSFGVLLMEVVTGRDPVDYSRPPGEVNLVEWLKLMVGQRRSEEVADPNLDPKPTSRALKRALLIALRCVDPDSSKRPKMGHVVHMLEADEFPYRDDRRTSKAGRPPAPDPQKMQRPVDSDSKRGNSRY